MYMVECAMDQGVCKFNVNTEVRQINQLGQGHMDEDTYG
jgi:hypothetical protein